MKPAAENREQSLEQKRQVITPSAKRNGFVLVLVIMALALVGAQMFILAGGSNIILFEADNAYLTACERNLTESGLAWAQKNIKNNSRETFDKSVKLDITDMDISRAALSVAVNASENEEAKVLINTSCGRRRRTLRHSKEYRIRPG